jgi:hypothetical protein
MNYYPEKKAIPYKRTTIDMDLVIAYLRSMPVPVEVKKAAYIIFRFESNNGKKGLNHNYVGAQADSGRWPEKYDLRIEGVVYTKENGTGKQRIFVAFRSWMDSIEFLVERVRTRGLYIGEVETLITKKSVANQVTLADAYAQRWIVWPVGYKPSAEDEEKALAIVGLAVTYKRSWVTGLRSYLPSTEEVAAVRSMYKQANLLFN